jgi:hypothetical protein
MYVENVGGFDRFVRILAGIVLLGMIFVGPKTLWGLVGVVPLVTGIGRTCPLYRLFGFNTCRTGSR